MIEAAQWQHLSRECPGLTSQIHLVSRSLRKDHIMKKKSFRNNRKSNPGIGVLMACLLLVCSLAGCNSGGKNVASPKIAEEAAAAEKAAESAAEMVSESAVEKAEESATAQNAAQTADPGPDPEIEQILAGMTLEEKVGQMFMPSFRVWQEEADTEGKNLTVQNADDEGQKVNVTELNDQIRECIAKYHFGGVLLFAENFRDAEQTLRLTADLQQTNQEAGGLPLLVAADQEGGYITRLTFGTRGPGNMALAATGNPEYARTMASIYGKEMSLVGVNTDFAPVMDINNNPNNPVIGVRSFGDSPEAVAEYGISYMEGLHDQGTIVTLKHFPGHGNTDTDSHTGFPCIESSYEELKGFELVPFQAALDAGADMVMTAHIQYPKIETGTYTSISTGDQVYLPATMSHRILTDILRGEMGFEGVVVTDALDMAAIAENFSMEDTVCMTINAGANLLIPPTTLDAEKFRQMEEMTELAVRLAKDGKIDGERIDDSVRRILTLKKKYGILGQTDFSVTEEEADAAVKGVGSDENRETAWDITEKALTLVKNENEAFPVKAKAGQSALILFADSCASRAGAGEFAKQILTEKGFYPEGTDLVHSMYDAGNLDPDSEDGLSAVAFERIIEERHAAGKKAILISAQLPYDVKRFPQADAILLSYGAYVMREIPPASGEGSAYMPNLPAAICACFGMGEPTGKLPVVLPEIDEHYKLIVDP